MNPRSSPQVWACFQSFSYAFCPTIHSCCLVSSNKWKQMSCCWVKWLCWRVWHDGREGFQKSKGSICCARSTSKRWMYVLGARIEFDECCFTTRFQNSPHSDVVVDRLRVDDREVDVDAITRRNPDCPHAVLEVWILGWVSRRINCAIHGCYIPTAQSWRERRESGGLAENPTAYQKARKRFLLLFMGTQTLT